MATVDELQRKLDECFTRMTLAAGRAQAFVTSAPVDDVRVPTPDSVQRERDSARADASTAFKEWLAALDEYMNAKDEIERPGTPPKQQDDDLPLAPPQPTGDKVAVTFVRRKKTDRTP